MEREIGDSVRRWISDDCLPFWRERAADRRYGGFVEELTFDGQDAACSFKRTRVTCRQIYVFAEAKAIGEGDSADLIAHGADYLTSRAWMKDKRAFAKSLTRDGVVLDSSINLYDHAFALFAFAHAFSATRDAAHRDWAHRTLDAIETHLRIPGQEGFWHLAGDGGHRQQNPHMHLLEAALAAFDATGEDRFRTLALEISGLFKRRFFQPGTGTLGEYFTADLKLADGTAGTIVEPGHLFEWIWILDRHAALLGGDFSSEIAAMSGFARRFGIDRTTGAVFNSVTKEGVVIDGGSRTWPNTELLKAGVALHRRGAPESVAMVNSALEILFDRYLASRDGCAIPKGCWIDAFGPGGASVATSIPTSTLYHVFFAFAEYLRAFGESKQPEAP